MASQRNISLTDLFNLYPESPCVVVVKNISNITSRDTFERYLAEILNVGVKEVHYPADVNGCCIAVFYRPIRGLWKFRKALDDQPLDGHVLNLSSLGRCDGLLIRNPPSDHCTAVLETFWKSEEFTGVTEEAVKDVEYLNCDKGRFVVVQIPDTAVISKILNRCEQSKSEKHNLDLEINPYFPSLHDLLREQGSHGIHVACTETDLCESVCEKVGTAKSADGVVMQKPVKPPKNEVADGVVMRKPVKPSKNAVPKYQAKVQASDDTGRPKSEPVLRDKPPKETDLSQSINLSASDTVTCKNQMHCSQSNGHTIVSKSTEQQSLEINTERLRLQKLEQEAADEALARSIAAQEQEMLQFDRYKSEPDQWRKQRPHPMKTNDRYSKTHHRTASNTEQGNTPALWANVEINEENPISWSSFLLNLGDGFKECAQLVKASQKCAKNIAEVIDVAREKTSSKKQKSTKRCTEDESLAPNDDSMQETETFFQPLEKHENISDGTRKKIKKILKKYHVTSNKISGSRTFMLEGDKESVKKAYEEIIKVLFTGDTEDKAGTNLAETAFGNAPNATARKGIVEHMALKDDPKVPKYWKNFNPGSLITDAVQTLEQNVQLFTKDHIRVELDSGDPVFKAIEKIVKSTWGEEKAEDGLALLGLLDLATTDYKGIRIKKIHRIENLQLYEKYSQHRKRTFLKLHRDGRKCCNSVERIQRSWGPVMTRSLADSPVLRDELFPEINEYFFFHGTSRDAIVAISNTGLDFRLGNQGLLYGPGVYMAESPTKADQYVDPSGARDRQMFLVRVILGDIYLCTDLIPQKYRRPPCADMKHLRDDCTNYLHGRFDSLIGQSRKFREFVVYEKDQCYPEYVITYTRK